MFIFSTTDEDVQLYEPFRILDQSTSDKCEAYAAISIVEQHTKEAHDPNTLFDLSLKVSGGLPPTISQVLKAAQKQNLIKSYSKVWGLNDNFNLIRGAIKKGYPVMFGLYWQQEWDTMTKIEDRFQDYKYFPHAMVAIGQKKINGVMYLIVQNSKGTSFGDDGICYLSQNIPLLNPYIVKF